MTDLTLCELQDETIDYLLGMQLEDKRAYFHKLVEVYYPNALNNEDEYEDLIENYISCMYVEKLYRSNRFFNERFTIIYTQTGLIRNIINDVYFIEDDLITH
tara:strand:- start:8691 stop:8996 length:306 start_codon:yes stop_codon:yes gene_type:complete